jgi:hypothetical protein
MYRRAADEGDPEGQLGLAHCLRLGIGIDVDKSRAFTYYQRAAEQGLSAAIVALGDCWRLGQGTRMNPVRAAALYKQAADLGDPAGMFSLGNAYHYGHGVDANQQMARELYRQAAARNYPDAVLAYRHMQEIRSREELERDLADWIVDFSRFTKLKKIGSGTYGSVKLMENKAANLRYAVKTFPPTPGSCPDISISFLREVDALMKLSHPCVLQIRGVALPDAKCGGQIATDFMEHGSLETVLEEARCGRAIGLLTHDRIAMILAGIALGMRHMHRLGYFHRDLKPGNLMLDRDLYVRIGDFGSCKLSVGAVTQTVRVGTPLYSAPEVYENADYTGAVDVYSFALIWYEIVTGNRVFSMTMSFAQIARGAADGIRPRVPEIFPPELKDLMTQCWSPLPDERKSFEEICTIFRASGWKFFPDVNTRAVAQYADKIEQWERDRTEGRTE